MIVLEHAPAYGISMCKARRFTEEEKEEFAEWFRDIGFSAVSDTHEDLPHVTWQDLPDRPFDGSFLGCYNTAWILTEEEVNHYRALEAARAKAAREKAEAEERKRAERDAQIAADEAAIRAKIDRWDMSDVGAHEVKHTFSINGETLQFFERDIFDFGVVINPDYAVSPGLNKGGMYSINNAGVRVWQNFRAGEGWYEVRPLTESEAVCVKAIGMMGRYAHSQIRM